MNDKQCYKVASSGLACHGDAFIGTKQDGNDLSGLVNPNEKEREKPFHIFSEASTMTLLQQAASCLPC
jgi:hypothetical protein